MARLRAQDGPQRPPVGPQTAEAAPDCLLRFSTRDWPGSDDPDDIGVSAYRLYLRARVAWLAKHPGVTPRDLAAERARRFPRAG